MIAGTPTFVAPEQAAAQSPDARADQYSLAALAFLLLTGRPPFTHASLSDAMNPGDLPPVSTPERPFPPEVERGAAPRAGPEPRRPLPDRHRVRRRAWTRALGPAATGPATQPWLDRDPELTQPGPRPDPGAGAGRPARAGPAAAPGSPARACWRSSGWSPWSSAGEPGTPPSTQPRPDRADRRRRHGHPRRHRAVPTGTAPTRTEGWVPPNADGREFPALSVGTSRDWATSSGGDGVFVGLLRHAAAGAGAAAPRVRAPGRAMHDSERRRRRPRSSTPTARAAASSSSGSCRSRRTGCCGSRSAATDRATANQVLDDVETHGIYSLMSSSRLPSGGPASRSAHASSTVRVEQVAAAPAGRPSRPVTATDA